MCQPLPATHQGLSKVAAKWRRWVERAKNAHKRRGGGQPLLIWVPAELWRQMPNRLRVARWQLQSSLRGYWLRAIPRRAGRTAGAAAPAFDLRAYNPVGWQRDADRETATRRVVRRRSLRRLRRMHHLEDVAAFHPDAVTRAGVLARLAAAGVVVHLADGDERLRPRLGDELYRLMTADARGIDAGQRELLSIRMRRAALREHSSWARSRRLGPEGLPLVSVLLATRRPRFLDYALDSVARQTYPNLELVLALHGEGFAEIGRRVAGLPVPAKALRIPASEPLGAVLNTATEASSGTLLTKMDDDDAYGADHLWDLVLAREYSGAQLVGKFHEFAYLAASRQTVYQRNWGGERYVTCALDGGTMLISRDDLTRAGGWRNVPRYVDLALWEDVTRAGGRHYRTHGAGFMLVRHGQRHTWEMSDDYFLGRADRVIPGWNPALAGIEDLKLPHPALAYEAAVYDGNAQMTQAELRNS